MDTIEVIKFKASELPEAYFNMILSKWMRSLRFGNELFEKVPSEEYFKNYEPFVKMLMSKPGSTVRLAVLKDDRDVALGFSVCREDVCDYVHVHKDYRRQGLSKLLVPPDITTMSHYTKTIGHIWQGNKKYKHLRFNPFA